jgi:hypothetical protein
MSEPKALPGAGMELPKINATIPEPKLFLPIAANAMKAHHAKFGRYAKEWRQLTITFSAVPYHIYD